MINDCQERRFGAYYHLEEEYISAVMIVIVVWTISCYKCEYVGSVVSAKIVGFMFVRVIIFVQAKFCDMVYVIYCSHL